MMITFVVYGKGHLSVSDQWNRFLVVVLEADISHVLL
jgi:hypothetical protein